MTLLEELVMLITALDIPVETGVFSGEPPDTYAVLTPLSDSFAMNADDCPGADIQEVRISLFSRINTRLIRKQAIRAILHAGITITNRTYVEYETDTQFHHYEIDTAKAYLWTDDEEE